MKLSIITINYNNKDGLEQTIRSVSNQTIHDFEWIIIDGGSTDGSKELIEQYQQNFAYWCSEPDKGVYNAMNKGVRMATGDYCVFMNSGDELYSKTTVEEILKYNLQADFIEGITYVEALKQYRKPHKKINASFYIFGGNNYHQSSIISREMLLRSPYDEKLKIASDLKFNFQCIVMNNCSYSTIDVVISRYEQGGRSATIEHDDEIRAIYTSFLPPRIINDYLALEMLYSGPSKLFKPVMANLFYSSWLRKISLFIKRKILRRYNSNVKKFNDLMVK